MNRHRPARLPLAGVRAGFTLIELLVVISIIALMIAILLPALGMARETARSAQCLSNARQLGMVMQLYAHDYDDRVPGAYMGHWGGDRHWFRVVSLGGFVFSGDRVANFTKNATAWNELFTCPTQEDPAEPELAFDYGLNGVSFPNPASFGGTPFLDGRPLQTIRKPSLRILIADANPSPKAKKSANLQPTSELDHRVNYVHNDAINPVYVDGHAATRKREDTPQPTDRYDLRGFDLAWGHWSELQ